MRARRTVYIVIFLVASVVAAGVYYLAQPRLELVRAKVDIPVLTQITPDMVELVRVSPLDAPQGTARSVDAVVGRYAALPILAGQDVDTRALEATPGSRAFGFGAPLAPGQVAFALPVDRRARRSAGRCPPAPGSTSSRSRTRSRPSASRPAPARPRSMMGQGLTILALRTTDGHQLGDDTSSSSSTRVVVPPKLGSVVVAIPAARLADFATAALTSTFYLALDPAPPGAAVTP